MLQQDVTQLTKNGNGARKYLCAQYTTLGSIPYGVPLEKIAKAAAPR
jgi:hypothetical protein